MHTERYTTAEVIEAIQAAKGLKSVAARRLGCTWWTVHNYCRRHPTVQRAYEETREQLVDLAEAKLMVKLNAGEDTSIIKWVLATLGKDRGWVERKELTGADGEALQVNVTYASDNTDPA